MNRKGFSSSGKGPGAVEGEAEKLLTLSAVREEIIDWSQRAKRGEGEEINYREWGEISRAIK